MNYSQQIGPIWFPWYARAALGLVGFGLLALLALAVWLEPDPRGFGTHQQLGLPPCTFEVLFDCRCPSCGMTTSWSYLVRGQLLNSLRANCGGTMLALVTSLLAPWMVLSALAGRWVLRSPDERVVLAVAVTISLVTLVDWTVRIVS